MSNQEQQPAPAGLGAVLSIVQAVTGLVPRWLILAVGVVFLSWSAFEIYVIAQSQLFDLQVKREKAPTEILKAQAGRMSASDFARAASEKQKALCAQGQKQYCDVDGKASQ